ncbi:MAG: ElyC/SanA/YdcF family protein [Myxococcota bacterium]
MPRPLLPALLFLAGCAHKAPVLDLGPRGVDVAILPGCPTDPDGHLSTCQWRRVVWGAHLYRTGVVRSFVTSGGAAHTPFVEAEALAAGLEALGVPASAVHLETQALHTDQNVGYSLSIVRALDLGTVGVASEGGHAEGMCSMAARWGTACTPLPLDEAVVSAAMAEPLPDVQLQPIPHDEWVATHREPKMATSDRYSSFGHYAKVILTAAFTGSRPPHPPAPEPSVGRALGSVRSDPTIP